MGKRSFMIRSLSNGIGAMLVTVPGAIFAAGAGIGCILFTTWYSADYNRNDDEDTLFGGIIFGLVCAILYGMTVAPAIWRRRPFQAKPEPEEYGYSSARPFSQSADLPTWCGRHDGHETQGETSHRNPFWGGWADMPQTSTREPRYEVPPVSVQPILTVEEAVPSNVRSEYVPYDGPTTLIGFPAAIEQAVIEAEEKTK